MQDFNKLKGIIIGTNIGITALTGTPINNGVYIKFINTIAEVIVITPIAKEIAAPFFVFIF